VAEATRALEESDVRYLPSYSFHEAWHYLAIPRATLRSWIRGRSYSTERGEKFSPPVIELPPGARSDLSFINLVEAHVLRAIRRKYGIQLQRVRAAIDYLTRTFESKHPLAEQRFMTDGVNLFIEHAGSILSASEAGQLGFRDLLLSHLRRIEYDETGVARRLFPFTKKEAYTESRIILIDPALCFGRPVLAGTGIATAEIARRFEAGERVEDLASDYGVSTERVQEAIRCEYRLMAA
jgi:uncharacterized protein (DUF433 family)